MAIANRGLRFGLNAWVERSASRLAGARLRSVTGVRAQGLQQLVCDARCVRSSAVRDGGARHREVFVRSTRGGYARERREAIALMTRAAAALPQRGQRMASTCGSGGGREDGAPRAVAQHDAEGAGDAPRAQQLDGAHVAAAQRRALALIARMRRGWLRWRAVPPTAASVARRSRALKTLTPEGRAMRRALNSWAVLLRQRLACGAARWPSSIASFGWRSTAGSGRTSGGRRSARGRAGARSRSGRAACFNSWPEEAELAAADRAV